MDASAVAGRLTKLFKNHITIWMLALGLVLLAVSYLHIIRVGGTCDYRIMEPGEGSVTAAPCDPEDAEHVAVLSVKHEKNYVKIRMTALRPGRAYVSYDVGGERTNLIPVYIHRTGVLTVQDYFGACSGMLFAKILLCLYLALWIVVFACKLHGSMKRNLYQYRNILYCGMIIFLAFLLFEQVRRIGNPDGAVDILDSVINTLGTVAMLSFPILVILSILVMCSNIKLIRKEGCTWRNMLAFLLGVFLSLLAILPGLISWYLQWHASWIDVHHYTGAGRYVGMFIESLGGIAAVYLECILAGTIIMTVKAARRIPSFDRDYIIIHGSQIRKDGTLTKLLQGRADRAIEFAKLQKEATGKDIIFVPSGGKGSDEVISEAAAIRNYLLANAIPAGQILTEDQSVSTEENLRNSAALIRQRSGEEAKVAFATTNYHVFRAGLLGTATGLDLQGIGSKTKRYFWVNAFVREFIATLYAERKRHLLVFATVSLACIVMIVMMYVSTAVLSF